MRMSFLVAAAAITGCASGGAGLMDSIMASWSGASTDEVIGQWGYPDEEKTVVGRKLLLWHRNVALDMPATSNTSGTVQHYGATSYVKATTTTWGGGTSNWACTRILEIREDRVVGGQWKGNNCPFLEAGPYSGWRRR